MIQAALLATAGFLAVAVTLVSVGPTGTAVSALALGLGMGGLASLTGGVAAFLTLSGLGAAGFVLISLGRMVPRLAGAGWLLGRAPIVGRERVFDVRSLRLLAGVGSLMATRLLSGHLAAGTVSTQGPAFACVFAWEAGVIRVATGRGAADLALGSFCAAMGTSAFMLLSSAHTSLGWAALIPAVPAVLLVVLAWSAPWETGS